MRSYELAYLVLVPVLPPDIYEDGPRLPAPDICAGPPHFLVEYPFLLRKIDIARNPRSIPLPFHHQVGAVMLGAKRAARSFLNVGAPAGVRGKGPGLLFHLRYLYTDTRAGQSIFAS